MSLSVRQFLQESNLGDPSHGLRALFPGLSVISLRSFVVRLILQTNIVNPPHDGSNPIWANQVCQNQQFLANDNPPFQWTPVLTPAEESSQLGDSIGISGWAVKPELSVSEIPFNHPFDNDWEFWIAPDQQYVNLLAPSNLQTFSKLDPDYSNALADANNPNGLNLHVPGVLGVETDQGLVPPDYRAKEGDRVVVFGRWIVDCGHTDFHTEIHPPLLLASARPAGTGTSVKVISRPFLVLQEFTVDNKPLRAHLLNEIGKLESFRSTQIECHVKLLSPPFARTHSMSFFVKPPTPRQSPTDTLLLSCHFTVRSGVTVEVTRTPYPDEVQVLITMNEDDYKSASLPPKLPHKHSESIQIADLKNQAALGIGIGLGVLDAIFNPVAAIGLAEGIAYDRYDAPVPQSVHDSENAVTNVVVDQNMGTITPTSVGDDQPFPVYGSLTLQWG